MLALEFAVKVAGLSSIESFHCSKQFKNWASHENQISSTDSNGLKMAYFEVYVP